MAAEQDAHPHVLKRFEDAIQYYWVASRRNKRSYKLFRYLTVCLGALVTLIASLSAMDVIASDGTLRIVFTVGTPILAAGSAVVGGLSQSFQWGAAWHDMVMTAQRLERERDDYVTTPPDQRDPREVLARLNDLILDESDGFFSRILGRAGSGKTDQAPRVSATAGSA